MKTLLSFLSLVSLTLLSGCATDPNAPEKGPGGTIAYFIKVESSVPARIEVNGDYIGNTPLDVKLFADKDGTFHSFGSQDWTLKAFPIQGGQEQVKVFHTGSWFQSEDKVPKRVFFEMNSK